MEKVTIGNASTDRSRIRVYIYIYTHSHTFVLPLLMKVIELIMSGKVSRKQKQRWKSQIKLMNEAKAEKRQRSGTAQHN